METLRLEELSAANIVAANGMTLKRGQEAFLAANARLEEFVNTQSAWQRVVFDAATMEDVGGGADDDDEATGGRDVCCVVFPGIVKHGDESGAQMHFTNVIARARVLCSSE